MATTRAAVAAVVPDMRLRSGIVTASEDEIEYRQERYAPPPGATEILLVRHGESAPARPSVPFPLCDGQADPELAPDGRRQAEQVARRLAVERLDGLYVTPLRRTAQTAAPLIARTALVPRVEPELREVHLGEWEGGIYRQRVAQRHPVALRVLAEERWDIIPGAEPAGTFAARVRTAISRLAAVHPDERVAVFTHGGVIAQALALAAGSRPFAFLGADNGSISQLVVAEGIWVVRLFNDTAHLEPG